jgi:hypothetical protein
MNKTPKKSYKRYHGKSTSFQPRNERVSVMLSAHEKNEYVEKCFAHSQDLSEKGRSLFLAWLYDIDELAFTIQELSAARKKLYEYEQKMKIDSEQMSLQREQISHLLELCRKNNITLPGDLNFNFDLPNTQGSKNDFEKRESAENDSFSLLW